ncbi:hypothetical protein [Alteribacillus sp. HJP-4]
MLTFRPIMELMSGNVENPYCVEYTAEKEVSGEPAANDRQAFH